MLHAVVLAVTTQKHAMARESGCENTEYEESDSQRLFRPDVVAYLRCSSSANIQYLLIDMWRTPCCATDTILGWIQRPSTCTDGIAANNVVRVPG